MNLINILLNLPHLSKYILRKIIIFNVVSVMVCSVSLRDKPWPLPPIHCVCVYVLCVSVCVSVCFSLLFPILPFSLCNLLNKYPTSLCIVCLSISLSPAAWLPAQDQPPSETYLVVWWRVHLSVSPVGLAALCGPLQPLGRTVPSLPETDCSQDQLPTTCPRSETCSMVLWPLLAAATREPAAFYIINYSKCKCSWGD